MKSLFRLVSGAATAAVLSGAVMAQDAPGNVCSMSLSEEGAVCNNVANLDANIEISTDEGFTQDTYCQPLTLATPTAGTFFNRIECGEDEDVFDVNEQLDDILENALEADEKDVPTIEDYFNGNALAKCVYDSFPGKTVFEVMPDGRVQTGDYVILEADVKALERIATFECRGLNMS